MNEKIVQLKVAEANTRDVGRGIARIDPEVMAMSGIEDPGEIICIQGKRETFARVMPTFPEKRGKSIIQIDGIIRENAQIGLDEQVKIRKTRIVPAKSLSLFPLTLVDRTATDQTYLKRQLSSIPVMQGDRVQTTFLGSRKQDFRVADTAPSGPVLITPQTAITITREGRSEEARLTYEDIGGLDEQIKRIREMIELPLRFPHIFARLGIEAPKGVLLHGPPGCGKTLIAKVIANETDASFLHLSGPEIIHKFYGESEAHLRSIFEKARRQALAKIHFSNIWVCQKEIKMSSEDVDTTIAKARARKSTRRGTQGLKGVQDLKGVSGLKGVEGMRGADDLRGVHNMEGVKNVKSAAQLRGARAIPGINKRNPKLEMGIDIVQALLQYGLKSNIEKLQENVGNLSSELKENLQSGLQSTLHAPAHIRDDSPHKKEKNMADTDTKETTKQDSEKNVAKVTPESSEQSGSTADVTTKPEQGESAEENKTETRPMNVESLQDMLHKFSKGFKTTKETLDKVASGVQTAQDVLDKVGPNINQQPGISSIRDTLNKVSQSVNTAQGILNKVAPLVNMQDRAKFLLPIVVQVLAGAHAIQEILEKIKAALRSLQDLLGKIASGVQALGYLPSLLGKKETIQAIQNKFLAVIHTLQDILRKIIAAIGKAQSVLVEKITSLLGSRHKEEGQTALQEPAPSALETEISATATLAALKQANIINMDAPLKSLFDQLEELQPDPATGWGVIGDAGHMVLVWSGQ